MRSHGKDSHHAGTASTAAAPSWLPAATAIGRTPLKWRLVKFAAKPYETLAAMHASTARAVAAL